MKFGENYVFNNIRNNENYIDESASIGGVMVKAAVILGVALFSAIIFMGLISPESPNMFTAYIIAGILTFILQLIISFSPLKARYLAIPYAISEGLILGTICGLLGYYFGELGFAISSLALIISGGIFAAATLLYLKGKIVVTSKFRKAVSIMSFGLLIGLVCYSLVALLFLIKGVNLYSLVFSSPISVLVSLFMIFLSTFYIINSLDYATNMVNSGMDKQYEWYAGFGIAINVIWLYIEVLRLLIKLLAIFGRRD